MRRLKMSSPSSDGCRAVPLWKRPDARDGGLAVSAGTTEDETVRTDIGANPEQLFCDRAADYQRSRSSYPGRLLADLGAIGFGPDWTVAELGSGTGLFAEMVLDAGNRIFAVEPNDDMRGGAESRLGGRPGFTSVAGAAEDTGLAAASIDLIVSAQSFHYFDQPRAKAEFSRLLTPRGTALVLWNAFDQEMPSYEAFFELQRRHATKPDLVRRRNFARDEGLDAFFAPDGFAYWVIRHDQPFDLAGLEGLLFSLSYMPGRDDPQAGDLRRAVAEFFARHAEDGRYRLRYQLQCHLWRRGAARAAA